MSNFDINDVKDVAAQFPRTLLTNFFVEEEELYRKAIEESGLNMEIKDSAYDFRGNLLKGCKSLHYNREKDTSPFWDIFRELQKKKG